MGQRPYRHYSFILSLWAEGALPNAPHSAQRRDFKDLAELVRFLAGNRRVSQTMRR